MTITYGHKIIIQQWLDGLKPTIANVPDSIRVIQVDKEKTEHKLEKVSSKRSLHSLCAAAAAAAAIGGNLWKINKNCNSWEFATALEKFINKSSTGACIFWESSVPLNTANSKTSIGSVEPFVWYCCSLKKKKTMPICLTQAPRPLLYFCEACNSVSLS